MLRRVASGLLLLSVVVLPHHHSHDSPRVLAASSGPVSPVHPRELDTTTTSTTQPVSLPPVSPPARPLPRTGGGAGSPSSAIEEIIARYFPDQYAKARAVAKCESSLNPDAVSSGGGNWGLFQINTVHADDFEQYTGHPFHDGVLDPELNTMYARKLFDSNGWGPWTCA